MILTSQSYIRSLHGKWVILLIHLSRHLAYVGGGQPFLDETALIIVDSINISKYVAAANMLPQCGLRLRISRLCQWKGRVAEGAGANTGGTAGITQPGILHILQLRSAGEHSPLSAQLWGRYSPHQSTHKWPDHAVAAPMSLCYNEHRSAPVAQWTERPPPKR